MPGPRLPAGRGGLCPRGGPAAGARCPGKTRPPPPAGEPRSHQRRDRPPLGASASLPPPRLSREARSQSWGRRRNPPKGRGAASGSRALDAGKAAALQSDDPGGGNEPIPRPGLKSGWETGARNAGRAAALRKFSLRQDPPPAFAGTRLAFLGELFSASFEPPPSIWGHVKTKTTPPNKKRNGGPGLAPPPPKTGRRVASTLCDPERICRY